MLFVNLCLAVESLAAKSPQRGGSWTEEQASCFVFSFVHSMQRLCVFTCSFYSAVATSLFFHFCVCFCAVR